MTSNGELFAQVQFHIIQGDGLQRDEINRVQDGYDADELRLTSSIDHDSSVRKRCRSCDPKPVRQP